MGRRIPLVAVSASVAVALLLAYGMGFLSAGSPLPSDTVSIEGSLYSYTTVKIPVPPFREDSTPPMTVDYENASFTLWLIYWYSPGGGKLEGTLMEPNGARHSFGIAGIRAEEWPTWISPSGLYGVQWGGGVWEDKTHVRLLANV